MVSGGTDDSLRLQVIDVINGAETKRVGERERWEKEYSRNRTIKEIERAL